MRLRCARETGVILITDVSADCAENNIVILSPPLEQHLPLRDAAPLRGGRRTPKSASPFLQESRRCLSLHLCRNGLINFSKTFRVFGPIAIFEEL